MTNEEIKALQVCTIEAVDGCTCDQSVRWFNCHCPNAMVTSYKALPLNWRDVLEEGDRPDGMPTVEAVAEVLKTNPGAQVIYFGGDTKLYGGGANGETHFELSCEMARS